MKIGIFKAFSDIHLKVIEACKDIGVDYEVVDILSADWIKNVQESDCDGFFCSSTTISQEKKTILDERYYFVSQIMKRPIYPDYLGLFIHENKRNMAAWLEINNYPHAKTKVFTNKKEAANYLNNCTYPIVVKANVGAAASKVRIINSKAKAKRLLSKCFPLKDDYRFSALNLGLIYNTKVKGISYPDLHNIQKDYFLVQEFIHEMLHEWRIIKIGDSYFGHQKLLNGNFASGTGLVGWVEPPKELLLMVKELCEIGGFLCMNVDIFETKKGQYFINELQASFGSINDSQMYINDKPGRYRFVNGDFVFEEGFFSTFGSNRLKIEHFIEILDKNE